MPRNYYSLGDTRLVAIDYRESDPSQNNWNSNNQIALVFKVHENPAHLKSVVKRWKKPALQKSWNLNWKKEQEKARGVVVKLIPDWLIDTLNMAAYQFRWQL